MAPTLLAAPPPLTGLPGGLEETVQAAIAGNPDVLAATFAEKAAQKRVREVVGELLPTISLDASVSHVEETSLSGSESDKAQVLATITVPLYQQGEVSSRVREAKQISNQRRLEIDEATRATITLPGIFAIIIVPLQNSPVVLLCLTPRKYTSGIYR